MVYMLQPEAIEFCNVVVVKRVKDLASILAAAHQAQLTQSAQLMRDSGLGHLELRRELTDVHFAFQQNGNDPQASWVAEGAEQVGQMGGRVFFKYHNI